MNGTIVRFGVDTRDHLINFQSHFYKKHGTWSVRDDKFSSETLGKNWSAFLYEDYGKNFLVLFDGDDGSGGTPTDCKLVWNRFHNLVNHYGVTDYLILKIQHAVDPEQRQFYPFKRDVYPLGLMANDPDRVFAMAPRFGVGVERDIDVLFVGGRVHDKNGLYCWPKHRDAIQHWPTNRKAGYAKLLEIKARRPDLRIAAYDDVITPDRYYELVARSKVCLDFPGIGLSSRKFYEFLVLGKCVLALRQNSSPWPLREDVHYSSLGTDYAYDALETAIDRLLLDDSRRESIETAARALAPSMTFDAVSDYVAATVDDFVGRWRNGTLDATRIRY